MAWKLNPERQIWLQLVDVLKFRIVSGQYPAGVKLPSVRELAAEAGVNRTPCSARLRRWRRAGSSAPSGTPGAMSHRMRRASARRAARWRRPRSMAFCARMRQLGYTQEEIATLFGGNENE